MITNTTGVLWAELVKDLLLYGKPVAPRGHPSVELRNVQLVLTDPLANVLVNPVRRVNYRFMVAEWLWIWFGRDDVAAISRYNPNIAKFSDNGIDFNGSYGPRLKEQWDNVMSLLAHQPDTRQAVLHVFDQQDIRHQTKDVPCTLTLQFLARDGKLHLTVNMRSSDVWLGLPYDVFNFTMLQNVAATELMVELGDFTMNLASSHLYDVNREAATQVLLSETETVCSPVLTELPPTWLEDVLTDVTRVAEPGLGPHEPWSTYAQALCASKSLDALTYLRRLK